MGRALTPMLSLLCLAACDVRNTNLGQGGGDGGAVPQSAECMAYVECTTVVDGERGLGSTYGATGTCWQYGATVAAQCTEACRVATAALLAANPRVVECGGSPSDAGSCERPTAVKLLLLLDQSGSMCVTDPPGSQGTPGFCEQITPPAGVTEPARVRGLKGLLARLATRPEVSVSVVPFDTNVTGPVPASVGGGSRFASASDPKLNTLASGLQSQLGKATDFEGALDYALAALTADVAFQKTTDAGTAAVAKTRYVVLLITDGTPFPRCSMSDALPAYANSTMPAGIWPDSPGASDFCNDADAGSVIPGFVGGTDRNQNAVLFSRVNQMRALVSQGAGSVTFNTQLLFNQQRIASCGAVCDDLYGQFPEVTAAQQAQAALSVARWTLQQMATYGGGAYSEALDNFGISQFPATLSGFEADAGCL